ncbi:DNA topoisomerase 3-alpha isoform X2 [Bacillus rossius redtenbacheri]|uniref:DNA topoisomerase 3-alpha isoform X2 n=1 Tax=Bacillus rossius redtenbacheri TaxID=93214 RepID=UPI002FDEFC76
MSVNKFTRLKCYVFNSTFKRFFTSSGLRRGTESRTMKVLCVAEKNDAAKNVAALLSGGNARRRDGLSTYNKIYEFECTVLGQRSQVVMTSVSGHLLGLEFVGAYRKWTGCSPLALFDAPVKKICPQTYEPIKRTLEREVRSCSTLIIWTDCDREGENIGFEIIDVCKAVKNNLRIYRAKFSEITLQSVQRALQNLTQPDERISVAVDVRQELDLRIGAAFTRFQTLRLKRVFPEVLGDSLISYGSCQFPTLGFVVERYKAITSFVPETFWKIKVNHTVRDLSVDFSWKRVRLFDQLACQVLYDVCMEWPLARVDAVSSKPKSKWRPLPLDTIELEKTASRKLKLNAKETMQIAERLYSQGYISYPRTETNIFPKELNLRSLIELQTNDPNWGEFAGQLLQEGPTPRAGKKSDQAHPPIHPTKYAHNLQGNESRVYEFVVRHFLACCSKDAEGLETIVDIDINEEKFVASGLMIIKRNYLDVYPYEKWTGKEIHVYRQGQTFEPTSIEMTDGNTTAPNLLTEADLIALMEKHGIGTDATHADHIETIKSRLYVGLENDVHFVPGQLGMGLVEGYDSMGFPMSKPNLRAELEADLKRICEGAKDPAAVLREQIDKYRDVFRMALAEAAKLDAALARYLQERAREPGPEDQELVPEEASRPAMPCPRCGLHMVVRQRREGQGFFLSCMGYPDCRSAVWFPGSVERLAVSDHTCPQCGPQVHKLDFKFRHNSMIPFCGDNYLGCVGGCDQMLLEALNVRLPVGGRAGGPDALDRSVPGARTWSVDSGLGTAGSDSDRSSTQPERRQTAPTTSFDRSSSAQTGRAAAARPPRQGGGAGDQENQVVCSCDEDALLLTVKKEGPNQGRKFYKCRLPPGQSCNFFMWADAPPADGQPSVPRPLAPAPANTTQRFPANTTQRFPANTTQRFPADPGFGEDQVTCNCGAPARRFTVHKEGPNTGRQFYKCPKPPNETCNFFKWADDVPANDVTSGFNSNTWRNDRSSHRGRGGSRGVSNADPSIVRRRKCGICGQEGHNRKNCPNGVL